MRRTKETSIEFMLNDLGFNQEQLDAKMYVMSSVLRNLGITYKGYYTRESNNKFKRVKRPTPAPNDLTACFIVDCDEAHMKYATYLYRERMKDILKIKKSYEASSDPYKSSED